uniref:Uncharacterized protein n=1 Tax=Strongyloides papillosus TaxID=174720 RepID=A0A0N5C146_STREA
MATNFADNLTQNEFIFRNLLVWRIVWSKNFLLNLMIALDLDKIYKSNEQCNNFQEIFYGKFEVHNTTKSHFDKFIM